jgi:cytosine/adenosine deaminase-related metal-dependent hydrolase
LKAHVEQCPKHPMAALKTDNERLREAAELVCVTMEEHGYGDMISFVDLRAALAEKG